MNNNTCGMVSVSLVACASLCVVSWVRLEQHISACMKAQKEDELWDGEDTQNAYEEDEFLAKQALNMPECKTTKGWSRQVCRNKRVGFCKPRWFAVHIKHWQFASALERAGIPVVGDCKNFVNVFAMNKEEAKKRIGVVASAMHFRVWEGAGWNDDWSFKLAIKPEFL
jgi:hypothetical protein